MLEAIKYVDKVIPEHSFEQKFDDFKKYNVDTFVIGSDYKDSDKLLGISDYCEVVILDRTPDISTSQLKRSINDKNASK